MTNYYVAGFAAFMLLTGFLARRKGYWFLLGCALAFLGPIGLVVALFLPDKQEPVAMTFKNRATAPRPGAVWRPPSQR
jgi:MFS family permease